MIDIKEKLCVLSQQIEQLRIGLICMETEQNNMFDKILDAITSGGG